MTALIWIIGGCLVITMGIFVAIGCHAMWMQHVWMWRLADTRWRGLELMARAQQLPVELRWPPPPP